MRKRRKRIVIALGGNAIKLPSQQGSHGEQLANIRAASKHILEFIRAGIEVVITHGNGPQIGALLAQQEAGLPNVPAQPMDVCGAMSQGQLGYMLQQALMNELKSCNLNFNVVTVITQVLVDAEDPDFANPSKPVGGFYDEKGKEVCEREQGYAMKRVLPGGTAPFRRVLPSPDPIRILEVNGLKRLVDAGMILIASGGGGVPVVMDDRGEFAGAGGVIDKDLAGEKLAEAVAADLFLILTDVPKVKLGFGTPDERQVDRLSLAEARAYLREGQFLAGSMAPKVLACIRFIEYGGERAIITSLDRAWPALQNQEGTHIVP